MPEAKTTGTMYENILCIKGSVEKITISGIIVFYQKKKSQTITIVRKVVTISTIIVTKSKYLI